MKGLRRSSPRASVPFSHLVQVFPIKFVQCVGNSFRRGGRYFDHRFLKNKNLVLRILIFLD